MKPELWRRAEELFHAALERSPEDRRAFLDKACCGDAELRKEVERLVSEDENVGSFLEKPLLADLSATLGTGGALVGRQFGSYRILSWLGAGGMGEVYRAHDWKLGRDVAIKTLPPEFACDPEQLARSRREARTLASLNHPNIAMIYGLEESAEEHYLVLELVEGEALHGPQPLAAALDVACQVAEALEAAHEHGIIHRDLKPANVKVTPQGRVKVLDFGLAKAIWGPEGRPDLEQPKALTGDQTVTGLVLGTPGYMSPEQARGEVVDQRTDIWAFGCLLYELLTGKRAFERQTGSTTALERDPDWDALPTKLPAVVRSLLVHCLEKGLNRRLNNISDALATLREVRRKQPDNVATVPRRRRVMVVALAGIALLVSASALVIRMKGPGQGVGMTKPPRIVVLPFDNLGAPQDAYFAAGMTEEITSRLANVKGLGVISRTSAVEYAKKGKTIKQVGTDLGVDYVLEGSVRWEHGAGRESRVRITPQLIRVADDTHVWSDRYERVIADVFAIQSEVAESVVRAMGVTVLPPEQTALETASTTDLEAYDLYLRGLELESRGAGRYVEDALQMYQAAADRDPRFAQAFAGLARMNLFMYWDHDDRSQERLRKGKEAVERAVELGPDLPEPHIALGYYFYWIRLDYPRALSEFAAASTIQPNNSKALTGTGAVLRRQGRWAEAAEEMRKAVALDPKNAALFTDLAVSCVLARRYADADPSLGQAIALSPQFGWAYSVRARLQVRWLGDVDKALRILDEGERVDGLKDDTGEFVYNRALLAIARRDYQGALRQLEMEPQRAIDSQWEYSPLPLARGRVQMLAGQRDIARRSFETARVELEQKIAEDRDDARYHGALGIAYAGLGRREDAVREAKLGCDMMPASKDAILAMHHLERLALVYTMVGRSGDAIAALDDLLARSGFWTPHVLRLDPSWDPLRADPRFQALLAKYEVKP